MILYSDFTDGSQFSEEKNGLEICFLVNEIFNKQSKKASVGSVQLGMSLDYVFAPLIVGLGWRIHSLALE